MEHDTSLGVLMHVQVREKKLLQIDMIGIDAVAVAVLAVGNARIFLERDHLDVRVRPSIERVEKSGTTLSMIQFTIVTDSA